MILLLIVLIDAFESMTGIEFYKRLILSKYKCCSLLVEDILCLNLMPQALVLIVENAWLSIDIKIFGRVFEIFDEK